MERGQNEPAVVPDDLLRQALGLSPAARRQFADRLYESVEPEDATDEWDPGYLAELDERAARYERGETTAIDAFKALEALRRKYRPSEAGS
jgi:hypothetical protein